MSKQGGRGSFGARVSERRNEVRRNDNTAVKQAFSHFSVLCCQGGKRSRVVWLLGKELRVGDGVVKELRLRRRREGCSCEECTVVAR